MGLIEQVLAGDARAAGRAMSLVEDDAPEASALLRGLAARGGHAHLIGFTGPPGVGKSTLLAALALTERERDRTVGIVAADPTSAFTGGALLGDRIRMRKLFEDPAVFIRSMATRDHPGSLPPAARDVCRVMDAMGKDVIFLETVGAGQSDIAVVRYADTIVLALSPATGDYIQAMKAGSIEVADIIAVNKADLPGADQAVMDLAGFLHGYAAAGPERCPEADHHGPAAAAEQTPAARKITGWATPVVPTCAINDRTGVEELLRQIDLHAEHLRASGELAKRRRHRLRQEITDRCLECLATHVAAADRLADYAEAVDQGRLTAGEAGQRLANDLLGSPATRAETQNGR